MGEYEVVYSIERFEKHTPYDNLMRHILPLLDTIVSVAVWMKGSYGSVRLLQIFLYLIFTELLTRF